MTPYELWQLEKYGNYYKEQDPEPDPNMDEMPTVQVKIYINN